MALRGISRESIYKALGLKSDTIPPTMAGEFHISITPREFTSNGKRHRHSEASYTGKIIVRAADGSYAKHRTFIPCACGRSIPSGRLHQHTCTFNPLNRKPKIYDVCEMKICGIWTKLFDICGEEDLQRAIARELNHPQEYRIVPGRANRIIELVADRWWDADGPRKDWLFAEISNLVDKHQTEIKGLKSWNEWVRGTAQHWDRGLASAVWEVARA